MVIICSVSFFSLFKKLGGKKTGDAANAVYELHAHLRSDVHLSHYLH